MPNAVLHWYCRPSINLDVVTVQVPDGQDPAAVLQNAVDVLEIMLNGATSCPEEFPAEIIVDEILAYNIHLDADDILRSA